MSWGRSALIAEVYDLDKPIGHSYGDVEYYTRCLTGTTGRILEVATGTGRILIPLLQAGLDVDGLDHSPEMIAVCDRHCREHGYRPALHVSDMADFRFPAAYQAVIIPAGSIKSLAGRDAVLRALACCYGSLQPGGTLMVDLAPPQLARGSKPMRFWRRDADLWTLQTVHVDYDAAANQVTELVRYEKWRDGHLVSTEMHPFCVQHWSPTEFAELLEHAGFTELQVTAGYLEDRKPGPHDNDWTFHAIRPRL